MIEDKPKKYLDATILIAIIPAYIYLVSFEYEFGYCMYFGIPKYLIEPSLTTILIFATTLFGVLFSSAKLLGFSLPFFRAIDNKEKTHLRGINLLNGICIIGGSLMIYSYPLSWNLIFAILATTAILNLFTWGIPFLILLRKKKSLKEKFQEIEDDYIGQQDNNDMLVHFIRHLKSGERNFFFVIVIIPIFSFTLGNGEAMKQKEFQKISTKKNTIILKKYNDIFVCAKFNIKTNRISDSLLLIKISENEPVILNSIKIKSIKE